MLFLSIITASPSFSQNSSIPGSTYIGPDGIVNPATAPIIYDGNHYSFSGNITGRLIVERDNIDIDASNYSIINYGLGSAGIYLTNRTNLTMKNANAPIYLENSSNCTIISNNGPIYLKNSFNNIIANNTIAPPQNETKNGLPVVFDGLTIQSSYNNSIYGNFISANIRSINLSNATGNKIYENVITKGGMIGIYLQNSTNNSVLRNNIINNTKQVEAWNSYNNAWDDGNLGNYWSDNAGNATYAIKITLLVNSTTIFEYDHKAQLNPYSLNISEDTNNPPPENSATPILTSNNPSQTPTPSDASSASPEPTKTTPQTDFQMETLYFGFGAALFAIVVVVVIALRRRKK
jgi:parallel beta-helix repeat protein